MINTGSLFIIRVDMVLIILMNIMVRDIKEFAGRCCYGHLTNFGCSYDGCISDS
jgi:hypothetical protein